MQPWAVLLAANTNVTIGDKFRLSPVQIPPQARIHVVGRLGIGVRPPWVSARSDAKWYTDGTYLVYSDFRGLTVAPSPWEVAWNRTERACVDDQNNANGK